MHSFQGESRLIFIQHFYHRMIPSNKLIAKVLVIASVVITSTNNTRFKTITSINQWKSGNKAQSSVLHFMPSCLNIALTVLRPCLVHFSRKFLYPTQIMHTVNRLVLIFFKKEQKINISLCIQSSDGAVSFENILWSKREQAWNHGS